MGRGPSPFTKSPKVLKAISPESLILILTSNKTVETKRNDDREPLETEQEEPEWIYP